MVWRHIFAPKLYISINPEAAAAHAPVHLAQRKHIGFDFELPRDRARRGLTIPERVDSETSPQSIAVIVHAEVPVDQHIATGLPEAGSKKND